MTEEFLVDSNILVYAFDISDAGKHAKASTLLEKMLLEGNGFLSAQNLAEFHSIATEKTGAKITKEFSRQILGRFAENFRMAQYSQNTIVNAINLELLYKIHFWDALLAATMHENGVKAIYTENEKDFKKIPWLTVINPLKQKPDIGTDGNRGI